MIIIEWMAANKTEAKTIAMKLLEDHLVACVNIISHVESFFIWKGKLQHEEEILVLMKTTEEKFSLIEKIIKEQASYDVPAILAFPISLGNSEYIRWVHDHF